MYTFTIDLPEDFAQALQPKERQCYLEMQDGTIIPLIGTTGKSDISEASTTTETITVNWKTN